ncbi:uncharacterized protein LOC119582249 [Penaeus monodon]|uniref:uncharacterized protein LOC119582249 n=1 Tax=Penaeus monodon TaxID=6687 RepID=UPI0018A7A8C7|nr:uncharacterized protein LOC119582249 [Penaeus monodon]
MKYSQKYSCNWESLPLFKGWLQPSLKKKNRAYCKACDCELNAKKSKLEKHAGGQKHKTNVSSAAKQPTLLSMSFARGHSPLDKEVKKGEIKLAAFVAEYNLPMSIMTHLTQLIKSVCSDSEIAKYIACSRNKTTAILKKVIGEASKEELVSNLKTQKFSIIVDESTDKGCTKHLCLLARLIQGGKANDVFLGLVPVQERSAQSLYDSVVKVFVDNGIPYKENMIGFASDGANAMMSSRLMTDVPNLFIMKCICHSFHLCASYACMTLPRVVEQLARDVYNYFMSSPKRLSEVEEFQDFVKSDSLSLQAVVCRVLEQYDATLSERIVAAEKTLQISYEIYLGGKVTAAIAQNTHGLSQPNVEEFLKRCLNFLIEMFKHLRLIDSKVVLKKSEPSIAPLVSLLPGIIEENKLNEIDNEWRLLWNTDLEVDDSIDTERLWQTVQLLKESFQQLTT